MRFHFFAIIVLILFGCAPGASRNDATGHAATSTSATAAQGAENAPTPSSKNWYLVIPPRHAYAADRPPAMGGPLATSGAFEHRGPADVYSLTAPDPNAPLSQWPHVRGPFATEKDCDDFKASVTQTVDNPQFVAHKAVGMVSMAPHSPRANPLLIAGIMDYARCVSGDQLASH